MKKTPANIKEVATTATLAVGIGVGVAAVAGIAAGAAIGAGILSASSSVLKTNTKSPVTEAEIERGIDGSIQNWDQVLKLIKEGGVAPDLREELWPILLGVFSPTNTPLEQAGTLQQLQGLYSKLLEICKELEKQVANARASGHISASGTFRLEPDSARDAIPNNVAGFAEAHRIIVMDAVRTDLRNSLLVNATAIDRRSTVLPVAMGDGLPELMMAHLAHGTSSVPRLQWRSELAVSTLENAGHLTDRTRHQMTRLVNILTAYAVHDPETGYCQGMSDLAAIFIQVFNNDALAFGCFERLMRTARQNFRHDETGIHKQLRDISRIVADTDPVLHRALTTMGSQDFMFAYRMVVVLLRRELALEEVCVLWESSWAHQPPLTSSLLSPIKARSGTFASTLASLNDATARAIAERRDEDHDSPDFILQFIAAVIRSQRGKILKDSKDNDDILRLFNGIRIDFWNSLSQARKQHKAFAQGVEVLRRL